jgi:hypothetical protein
VVVLVVELGVLLGVLALGLHQIPDLGLVPLDDVLEDDRCQLPLLVAALSQIATIVRAGSVNVTHSRSLVVDMQARGLFVGWSVFNVLGIGRSFGGSGDGEGGGAL